MPENAGFLYVLINPLMPGMVKVGKTERDPESRARELSMATGVPTPFILVYDAYFNDCSAAEKFVHTWLEQQGYRVSDNREFFSAPTTIAIQGILEALVHLGAGSPPVDDSSADVPVPQEGPDASQLCKSIFEEAEAHLFGIGETLQDSGRALKLYEDAARLGWPLACKRLGKMYAEGLGTPRDYPESLKWLQEAIRRGIQDCYVDMAVVYWMDGHSVNAKKCWAKYIKSEAFSERDAGCSSLNRAHRCLSYLLECKSNGWELPDLSILSQIRDEIALQATQFVEEAVKGGDDCHISRTKASFSFIQILLFGNSVEGRTRGKVTWLNTEEGSGFVSGDVYFQKSEILDHTNLKQGQAVEYDVVKMVGSDGKNFLCANNITTPVVKLSPSSTNSGVPPEPSGDPSGAVAESTGSGLTNFAGRDLQKGLGEVFAAFPDAAVIDGSDDWYSPEWKRPQVWSEKLGVQPLALFHSGVSGMTRSGIVVQRGDLAKVAFAFLSQYDRALTREAKVYIRSGTGFQLIASESELVEAAKRSS